VRFPVVLLVTESEVGVDEDLGYSSFRQGYTVKGLLGDDILLHAATSHITFRPIAPTIMLRALQATASLKSLPRELLRTIVDMSAGDIRSALNCGVLVAMQTRHIPRRKVTSSKFSYTKPI
jgi:hypothetical protein